MHCPAHPGVFISHWAEDLMSFALQLLCTDLHTVPLALPVGVSFNAKVVV